MTMKEHFVLGIDIGGSHITTGLVDIGKKTLVNGSEQRAPVDCHGSAEEILAAWTSAIGSALRSFEKDVNRLGIAMPGPFKYKEGISLMKDSHKFGALYKLNIREELARRLPIPGEAILFRNDAEAFLEGEVFCGAAAGCSQAVGLTLGTGLGSAIHHHGRTEDADWWCAPFMGGRAEDVLSTRWFLQQFTNLTGRRVEHVKMLADLVPVCAQARAVFDAFGEHLAFFLNEYLHHMAVERIVVGGNITRAFHLFQPSLAAHLHPPLRPKLTLSLLGEMAALVGSAALWSRQQPS